MADVYGATTAAVAAALTRLQGEGRWSSLRQLSAALAELPGGIKLSYTSLGQIARGTRHVTVDELTALATALDVSPLTLMMPFSDAADGVVEVTGPGPCEADPLLGWMQGTLPLDPRDAFETEAFRRRSLPRWAWQRMQRDQLTEDLVLYEEARMEGDIG